jgi:acyl dehydratase
VSAPLAEPAYRVRAHNAATDSENRIHSDDVAREYGFAGGLVPGVTVYAYMTRPVLDLLGPGWLAGGTMAARFLKPFYEGDLVSVHVARAEDGSLGLEARNEAGEVCATGSATLPESAGERPALLATAPAPARSSRPPASEAAFRANPVLGTFHERYSGGPAAERYLAEIGDDQPLFRGPGAAAHPGYLIRFANTVLVENVVLGPWIHVSTDARHFGVVSPGEAFDVRAEVRDLFERRGHRFVTLQVQIVGEGGRLVLDAVHTAIYDVRKVAASEPPR